MKAWVLHGPDDLRFEDVLKPLPGKGGTLIRMKAAGVCGSDIARVFDTGAHVHPIIIGHEFSGIVEAVGQDADPAWLHRRVGVFPLIPCGKCGPCRTGQYELCRNYDYLGSRRDGGFAEYVNVPAWNLVGLPDSVSFAEAAMLEPMAVAVHAMRRGTGELTLNKDAPVAVCGLGAIGLLLIMFLMEAGYRNLYAAGNKEAQKERAVSMGIPADHYLDSKVADGAVWIQEQTDGAALFFECTGRNEAAAMGINGVKPMGRVLLVGNPCSDMVLEKDTYWKILRNQITVTGTWNSSFKNGSADDWDYALDRLKTRRIDPAGLISHRLALEALEDGLSVMRGKKEDFCKVMVMDGLG